jgi:murein DD-endopeptidase MepM/ murein hydrolase activator NlpD
MSQVAVAVGQEVQQGEKVGYVGSTGLSIGAHLHFQLEVGRLPTAPDALVGCTGATVQGVAGNGPLS